MSRFKKPWRFGAHFWQILSYAIFKSYTYVSPKISWGSQIWKRKCKIFTNKKVRHRPHVKLNIEHHVNFPISLAGPVSEKSPVFLSSRNCKIQKHHVLANQFGQPPMFLDFRIYQNWADRTFFALCNNLGTLCRKFINPSRKAAPTSLSHTQTNNNGLDRCNGTPLSVLDHRLLMFLPWTCLEAPSPGPPYAQPISE